MKAVTAEMEAHLALDRTTLASCWKVTRTDGTIFGFTDHDKELIIDGLTYEASSGFFRSAIQNSATTAVDNLEVKGFLDNEMISEADLRNGAYDYASVEIFAVNWADLSMGIIRLRYGLFGEVNLFPSGLFIVELRGLTQLYAQVIGQVFCPECRADLGDTRCKIELIPPTRRSQQAYSVGQRVLISGDISEHNVHLDVLNGNFELAGDDRLSGWTRVDDSAGMLTHDLFGVTPYNDSIFNKDFFAPFSSSGSIFTLVPTMPPFTYPLNDMWQKMKLHFRQWQVASGWEIKGTLEFLNSSNVVLDTIETTFATVSIGSWVLRETDLINVPIGATKYRVTFSWQNSGGTELYPQVLIDAPFVYWREGDPMDSPPEDSPTSFHEAEILVSNGFNSSSDNAPFWSSVSLNGTVEGSAPFVSPRGANTNFFAQVGDFYGRTDLNATTTGSMISRHFIPLEQGPVTGAAIDAGDYDMILNALTGAEEFGWMTSLSLKFYDSAKAYISSGDLTTGMLENRPSAQWKPRTLRGAVPATARYCKIVCGWDRDSEQTAVRPMSCFDDMQLDIVQQGYTTDDLRRFGGFEYQCTTAGTTAADVPDTSGVVVGNTLADGSVVWTAVQPQWTWIGEVDLLEATNTVFTFRVNAEIDQGTAAFFDRGVLTFYTGPNAHKSVEIASFDNVTKLVTLEFPLLYAPEDGDALSMHAGCDLSRETCFSKFNNLLNFRGEPDIPGTDQYFKVGGQ